MKDSTLTHPILSDTDLYKLSHWKMCPNMKRSHFHFIPRKKDKEIVFFGLSDVIQCLTHKITQDQLDYANEVYTKIDAPFNYDGFKYIIEEYEGYLPLTIRGILEGTIIKSGIPLVTFHNYDSKCWWLNGWIETMMSRMYATMNIATESYEIKQILKKYMEISCNDLSGLPHMLHGFGSRSTAHPHDSAIGDLGHLLNFNSTDTSVALFYGIENYDLDVVKLGIKAVSAGEHSTISSWGDTLESETQAIKCVLDQFPNEFCVVPIDTFNTKRCMDEIIGGSLKNQIIERSIPFGVRPDSGDKVDVPIEVIEQADSIFGHDVNEKGYKVIKNIKVISANSISKDDIKLTCKSLIKEHYSIDNIGTFGMGEELLRNNSRRTFNTTIKCNAIELPDDSIREVYKSPNEQPDKHSDKGLLLVTKDHKVKSYKSYKDYTDGVKKYGDAMETYYEGNGYIKHDNFQTIRERTNR